MSKPRSTKRANANGISEDVLVPRPREVNAYLKKNAELAKVAAPICARTREEFGASAHLALEVYHDPEMDDHYLRLLVRLADYERDVLNRMDEIWRQFETQLADVSGWLIITSDFRSP